jgi:DNA replicative helicase MCM subunit Mcm2 (Cdc46/Mcm family)
MKANASDSPKTGSKKDANESKSNHIKKKLAPKYAAVWQLLSNAGSEGLSREELRELAEKEGIDEKAFNDIMKQLSKNGEIYFYKKDEKYRSVELRR